jgi:hypothetical protein
MRARPLLAFTLSCAALGVGAWWWIQREPDAKATCSSPAKPVEARARAVPLAAPESAPAPVVPKRTSDSDTKTMKHWWDVFVPGKSTRPAPAPVEEKPAPTISIDGVVVVTDSSGREHLEENGTLVPAFYDPASEPKPDEDPDAARGGIARSTIDAVTVAGGHFHVETTDVGEFGALKVTLGGRPAVVDSKPVRVVPGQTVTIRAHWIDGVRIHVVDKETGAELDEVTVVRGRPKWWSTSPGDVPAEDGEHRFLVLEHAVSPVIVPPRDSSYGVDMKGYASFRARDHAWAGIELDWEDRSERTVELVASATLVVVVQGDVTTRSAPANDDASSLLVRSLDEFRSPRDKREPMLRLRKPAEVNSFEDVMKEALAHYDEAKPSDFPGGRKPSVEEFKKLAESMRSQIEAEIGHGELVAERPAQRGEFRVDWLEPQELVVSIEVGNAHRSPLVLASAPARLTAGTTTGVTLVATQAETPKAVPLAGTIVVPRGWDLEDLRLDIDPIGLKGRSDSDVHRVRRRSWVPVAGRAGVYRWSAGAVLPATYVIRVDGTGIAKSIDVADPGNENVELVLPEPATLRVRLVSAADGRPAKMKGLRWIPTFGNDSLFGRETLALEYDSKSASYSARVPAGSGVLDTYADKSWEFVEEPPTLDVHPGDQELVVRVRPTCGVSFDFVCDGARVDPQSLPSWNIKLERIDGVKRKTTPVLRDSQPGISVGDPGRYLVKVPDLDGYEPVAPFEVDIAAGAFVKKTVELRKKR